MPDPKYVVVMRAASAARFREEDPSLQITDWPTKVGIARLEFRTRYADHGTGTRLPRELWIDARGSAPSLDDAREAYRQAAGVIGVLISFSANAAMQPPDVHLAFDNTPGLSEHEYYSVALSDDPGLPTPGRRVNTEATIALLAAVTSHADFPRMHRAISQYAHALTYWAPGLELLAVSHLFMAVDALTKIFLVDELQKAGCASNRDLAAKWNIDVQQLDAEVRRRLIFQGDIDIQKEMSGISNAFEHGYDAIPELLTRAALVRDKAAGYVRSAILGALRIDPTMEQALLAPSYVEPQPMYPYTAVLRGKLLGEAEEFAAPDQQYPLIQWKPRLSSVERIGGNQLRMHFEAKIATVSLGDGVSFLPISVEYYGPQSDPPSDDPLNDPSDAAEIEGSTKEPFGG